MNETTFYQGCIYAYFGLAALTLLALIFITAPYGRHARKGWGPTLSNRSAWILMECPAVLCFLAVYLQGTQRSETVPLILLCAWQSHYLWRTFIYPFTLQTTGKTMPLAIALTGFSYNIFNAYVNARFISEFADYDESWLGSLPFILGLSLFLGGMAINRRADTILRELRKPGETGYRIPRGSLYRWISCPNYFGEIIEWIGWAVMTWSYAGLGFALYTIANLAPRALRHHQWYRTQFDDYPPKRKALIPYLL